MHDYGNHEKQQQHHHHYHPLQQQQQQQRELINVNEPSSISSEKVFQSFF